MKVIREKEVKDRQNSKTEKFFSVATIILATLWNIGEGTVQAFFPHKYAKKYGYAKSPVSYRSSLTRLQKQGFIQKKSRGVYRLTSKGEKEALHAFINAETGMYQPNYTSKWDGGWRFIFFDVPEAKRKKRDFLRKILRTVGFKEFQKSVWVYPYAVPSFLRDLLFEEDIKRHTRFIVAESIEYDDDLRRMFPDLFFKNSLGK